MGAEGVYLAQILVIGGHMKKLLYIFVALLIFQPVFASVCCVNPEGNSCSEAESCSSGELTITSTINGCIGIAECSLGCCCAGPSAPSPDGWNSELTNVERIEPSCNLLGPQYAWSQKPADRSCVEFCLGLDLGPGPDTDEYTLSGTVTDGEQTLDSATVYFPYFNSPYQDTTEGNGAFLIEGIPAWEGFATATKEGCDPSQVYVILDQDREIDFQMTCGLSACEPQTVPSITAETVRGTDQVQLAFSADLSCGPVDYYHVVRRDMTHGGGITFSGIMVPQFIDEGLLPETEYCYSIAAHYQSGLHPSSVEERAEACITTGAAECMNSPGLAWCQNNEDGSAVLRCLEDNTVEETTCQGEQVCAYLGDDRYGCVESPPCEECNGLFGKLSNLVFSIFFKGTAKVCTSTDLNGFCFQDTTATVFDGYRSCTEVTSCESYLSREACQSNSCHVESCSWSEVYPELGMGVCRSTDQPPRCSACEDIFGTCNQNLCEAIGPGECYFDGENNGLDYSEVASRCVHKDAMACRYYDTQADCEGGNQPLVDVQYSGDERFGGSHEVTRRSNDKLDIGLCKWAFVPQDPAGGYCYKDADGRTGASPEDDCIENGLYAESGPGCLQDATPPQTSIIISEGVVPIHEITSLEFVLSDNYYSAEELQERTRFCIVEAEQDCYPDKTLIEAVAALPDYPIGTQGQFTIKYYSVDLSQNLEVVQEVSVTLIELGYPRLENAELR